MQNSGKKSFYVFLCGLLGMLLFMLLQRSLFLLAFLGGVNILSYNFQQLDYISFVVANFLGLWYGIWLGLHWYTAVYEEGSVGGLFSGISRMFGKNRSRSEPAGSWDLDDLVKMKNEETSEARSLGPRLEVFERNTVAFSTSNPVHARSLHERAPDTEKPKRTATKRAVKKVVKKTL